MLGRHCIKLLSIIECCIIIFMVLIPFNISASSANRIENNSQSIQVLPTPNVLDEYGQSVTQKVYDPIIVNENLPTTETEEIHAMGCIPSDPGILNMHIKSGKNKRMLKSAALLPQTVDWTADMPQPGNQGSQGSCVAWSTAYAGKSFVEQRQHNWGADVTSHQFSPGYVYNQLNGGKDKGISIAAALELMCSQGCDTLDDFPFNESDYLTQPTVAQKQRAAIFKNVNWTCLVSSVNESSAEIIKEALTQGTVIAAVPYSGWNNDGDINQIDYNSGSNALHSVCIVGFDDNRVMKDGAGGFKFINSWGTDWGHSGYGWMSYTWARQHIQEAEVMEDSINDSFAVSGHVFQGQNGLDEVRLSFSTDNGNVTVPQAATTGSNGSWEQSDFSLDASYRITPSKAGYSFNPSFIDFNFNNYNEANLVFNAILGGPSLVINSPDKEQVWTVGTLQTVEWNYAEVAGTFKLDLLKGGNLYSTLAPQILAGNGGAGSFTWNIPLDLPGGSYALRLTCNEDTSCTVTSDEFSISQTLITSPAKGDVWRIGTTKPISWNYVGAPVNLKIDLLKAGVYVASIASEVPSDQGVFSWLISSNTAAGNDYQLRFTQGVDGNVLITDRFSLQQPVNAAITVRLPNHTFSCAPGEYQYVTWETSGNPGPLKIDMLKGGTPVSELASNISAGIRSYKWQIVSNQLPGTDYQVRISSIAAPEIVAISEYFTIGQKANVALSVPLEKQYPGSPCTLNWTYSGNPESFNLDLYSGNYSVHYPITSNIPATGGSGAFTWSIPSDLPPANYIIIISSNSVNGACYNSYGMTIWPIIYTAPAPGEVWRTGTTQTIRWKFYDSESYGNTILLYKGNEFICTIATDIQGDQEFYNWQIPTNIGPSSDYKLLLQNNVPGKIGGCWSEPFSIKLPLAGTITVKLPDQAFSCSPGDDQNILWKTSGNPGTVKIELLKGGAPISVLASNISSNVTNYKWHIAANQVLGTDYQIKISSSADPEIIGISGYFTIGQKANVALAMPHDKQYPGSSCTLNLTYTGNPESFNLDLYSEDYTVHYPVTSNIPATGGNGTFTLNVPSNIPPSNYNLIISSNSVNGACYHSYLMTIWPIINTSPVPGEAWRTGTTQTIRWKFYDSESYNNTILLYKGFNELICTIATDIQANQEYCNWKIPANISTSSDYRILLQNNIPGKLGCWSEPFSIQKVDNVTATVAPITIGSTPTSITVPSSVANATLKTTTSSTPGGGNKATLPLVEVGADTSLGSIQLNIPDSTTITGPSSWDGTVCLPTVQPVTTVTAPPVTGYTSNVQTVIEVGYGDVELTFDKAVRLLIPGQGGKLAGYSRGGTFTVIPKPAGALDTQTWADSNITTAGDAAIDVGSDLVIWTKHFTKFASYTQTAVTGQYGGGGGTSTSTGTTITASTGGTITGSGATIFIPAYAISGDIKVSIFKISDATKLPLPAQSKLVGDILEITKDKIDDFLKPVTITMGFGNITVDPTKYDIGIYWFDITSSKWVKLDNTKIETVLGKASGETERFGKFAIIATEKVVVIPQIVVPVLSINDINGNWAQDNIKELVNKGAIAGYPDNSFRPDNTITRAEFVTVLVKAFQMEAKKKKDFTDTVNHWAKDYIATANAYGIIEGYDNTTFGPNDRITREQMAQMVSNAAKLARGNLPLTFRDADRISIWAKDSVAAVQAIGAITGYPDNTFNPQGNATRAEAVTVIAKALRINVI